MCFSSLPQINLKNKKDGPVCQSWPQATYLVALVGPHEHVASVLPVGEGDLRSWWGKQAGAGGAHGAQQHGCA